MLFAHINVASVLFGNLISYINYISVLLVRSKKAGLVRRNIGKKNA